MRRIFITAVLVGPRTDGKRQGHMLFSMPAKPVSGDKSESLYRLNGQFTHTFYKVLHFPLQLSKMCNKMYKYKIGNIDYLNFKLWHAN